MRRLLPLTLCAVVVLAGCGTEGPASVREPGPSSSQAQTPSAQPTRTPATAADEDVSLANFPLALGYAEENGDDHSPVTVTSKPGMGAVRYCALPAWDPRDGTSDLIGVEFRGEAEWSRGRTLVLYPTEADAATAVETARAVLVQCREEVVGDGYVAAHTVYDDVALGDQSLVWTDTGGFRQDGQILFDTGLTVYHLVRVGRAVLASYEYGEGNGGPEQRPPGIDRATDADRPVVDAMGALPLEPAAATLTPQGAGPLRLGMTAEQVRQAAPDAEIRPRPASCADLSWTSPDGVELNGAISDSDGIAFLSTPNGATAEGITAGDTPDDLRAAYPNLQRADNGLWFTDQGATDYAFDVDAAGTITWAMVTGDDQHCAG